MLIDAYRAVGLERMAQVDLGTRQNRHQPLARLSKMALEVLAAAERRTHGAERPRPAARSHAGATSRSAPRSPTSARRSRRSDDVARRGFGAGHAALDRLDQVGPQVAGGDDAVDAEPTSTARWIEWIESNLAASSPIFSERTVSSSDAQLGAQAPASRRVLGGLDALLQRDDARVGRGWRR